MERYGGERERGGQCVIGGGKRSERERLTFLAFIICAEGITEHRA